MTLSIPDAIRSRMLGRAAFLYRGCRPRVWAFALYMAAAPGSAWAQAPAADQGPVVYCRDAARGIVTRSLARDCPPGGVITEKEAQALRDENVERRRRLMFGDRPEAVPALPAEPVRAEPAAPVQHAPPPVVTEPPRPAARPAVPAAPEKAPVAEPAKVEAPKPAQPAASAPSADEGARLPARAAAPPLPPPPLTAEFKEVQALVAGMRPGEFRAVSKNTLRDVAPNCSATPRPFFCAVQGPVAIMSAWGGGAFDTKRNMLLITGGGHNDYAGNEVYHFRLDTLKWERATEPSKFEPIGNGQVRITDGTEAPVSFHSYDALVYVPTIDRMFAFPQGSYQSGTGYEPFAFQYDPGRKTWKRGARAPFTIGPDAGCDWWEQGGEVVCSTPNGFAAWKPGEDGQGTWRMIHGNNNQAYGRTLVVSPETGKSVQVWTQQSPLACFALNGSMGRHPCPIKGNTDFARRAASGIARASDGRLAIWSGGNEVWAVDPEATPWTVTRYASQTGPTYRDLIGIYGKWQYVPALDVFIGVRWLDEQVWLYKLPRKGTPGDSADSTPKVLPSAIVNALQDGQTVDLPKGTFADCIVVKASNVTVRGYGTKLIRSACEGGVATVISRGRNVVIEGLEIEDAAGDGATSCLGVLAGTATIRKVKTDKCPMNIRTGTLPDIEVTLEDDTFGPTKAAGQLQHGGYINKIKSVVLRRVTMLGCHSGGHVLKSRAASTLIEDSVLAQGEHNCSRVLDFSEGGNNTIRNSFLQHGKYAQNADIICDGCEVGAFPDIPPPGKPGNLRLEGVTVISDWNGRHDIRPNAVVPDIGPNANQIIIARLGAKTSKSAYFKNNRFVYDGTGPKTKFMLTWADQPQNRFIDEGENAWFSSRSAAGLKPYPALR